MKIAIVSDVHGNLEAFTQVLADIQHNDIDTIISLGDNIGYGPDSEQVMALIRSLEIPALMGNHELALIDPAFFLSWFNHLLLQMTKLFVTDYLIRLSISGPVYRMLTPTAGIPVKSMDM